MSHSILIIDDDEILADTLSEILTFEGYQTHVATGAQQGLRQIQVILPDIVVCDWQMPNLNGGELLRELRLTEATKDIPFIIITGHSLPDLAFEPSAILMKPVTIATLVGAIKASIQNTSV